MRKLFLLLIAALALTSFSLVPTVSSTNKHADVSSEPTMNRMLTKSNFQDSIRNLYSHLGLEKAGLSFDAFNYGMVGYYNLKFDGRLQNANLFTIIDFTQPSTQKRFYTIDFKKLKVVYHTYVAHGRKTGENYATKFSNVAHSNASSLGFYVTGETYVGSKGYSLKLDGVETAYNGNLRTRAVVIHDADYVSEYWIKKYGRLGRSQGCPALPKEVSRKIINTIKGRTAIFAYYSDSDYLAHSAYLNVDTLMKRLEQAQLAQTAVTGL
jgi:hypothetical protein